MAAYAPFAASAGGLAQVIPAGADSADGAAPVAKAAVAKAAVAKAAVAKAAVAKAAATAAKAAITSTR